MKWWFGIVGVMAFTSAESVSAQVLTIPSTTRVELYSGGRLIVVVGGLGYGPAMVPRLNEVPGYNKPDVARISGGPGSVYLYDNNTYQTNENWVGIRWPGGGPTWINLRENWVNRGPQNGLGLGTIAGAGVGIGSSIVAPEMAGGAIGSSLSLLPGGKIVSGDYPGRRDGYSYVFHRHANEPFGFTDNWKTDNISSVQVFPDAPRYQSPVPQRNGWVPQTPGNVRGTRYWQPGQTPGIPVPQTPPSVNGVPNFRYGRVGGRPW